MMRVVDGDAHVFQHSPCHSNPIMAVAHAGSQSNDLGADGRWSSRKSRPLAGNAAQARAELPGPRLCCVDVGGCAEAAKGQEGVNDFGSVVKGASGIGNSGCARARLELIRVGVARS